MFHSSEIANFIIKSPYLIKIKQIFLFQKSSFNLFFFGPLTTETYQPSHTCCSCPGRCCCCCCSCCCCWSSCCCWSCCCCLCCCGDRGGRGLPVTDLDQPDAGVLRLLAAGEGAEARRLGGFNLDHPTCAHNDQYHQWILLTLSNSALALQPRFLVCSTRAAAAA